MKKIKLLTLSQLSLALSVLIIGSCTDLEPTYDDSVPAETESGEFAGVDPEEFLTKSYVEKLGEIGDQANSYSMQQVSSNESVVVTRGADWGDNGVWRNMHEHTWRSDHPQMLTAWNRRNEAVFICNQIIAPASNPSALQLAEAKTLRALNMWYIMDMFGQVPFRDVEDGANVNPRVLTRAEAFDFIIKDLTEALPNLPEGSPSASTQTANKAWAHFLLAKMYLNKEVYTGSADASDYTKVVESADAIADMGYTVDDDYFGIFIPGNDNQELIITIDTWTGNRVWNSLHPNQGGWNGFATIAEVYDAFESSDVRLGVPSSAEEGIGKGLLIGPQFGADGQPVLNRQGNPLSFTKEYPGGILKNGESEGVRLHKYSNENEDGVPSPANNYVWARYSDVVLMKAEAILRGGSSSESAEAILDAHRTLRGATASGSYTLQDVLAERQRELYIEGWRRNDQIRFGTFSNTWDMKSNTEEFRALFPIPIQAIATNPNLTQNEGY